MRRILVVGIIVLFLLVGIYPSTAVDITKESNHPIQDEYEEIITHIEGIAILNWIKRKGIFRGEVEIEQKWFKSFSIRGLRLYNGEVEKFYILEVEYVYASRFIGISIQNPIFQPVVVGLAFGNIEWE